jgi:hypothetical protein
MRRQLTTTQKGLVLVLIPVCFELLFILIAFYQSSGYLEEIRDRENAILDNAANVICSLDRKFRFTGSPEQ